MTKIFVLCLAVLALTHAQSPVADANGQQFFMGLSSVFNLESDASSVIACGNSSDPTVFGDLGLAIHELEQTNVTGAVHAVFKFFVDVQYLEADCSSSVEPYLTLFGPAIAAYHNNTIKFDLTVAKNLEAHPIPVLEYTIELAIALDQRTYKGVGQAFGYLAQIGLSSYLNPSEEGFLAL
jgi:hypothetical protein